MRKHIFTLGLLLSSFCIMPAVPDWAGPISYAYDVFDDESLTTEALMHCDDCCGAYASNGHGGWVDRGHCWLPGRSNLYWDTTGGFTNSCQNEPTASPRPPCISDVTYSEISGKCIANCGTGSYDLGLQTCISNSNGTGGSGNQTAWTWYVLFGWGRVDGVAACFHEAKGDVSVGAIYSGTLTGGTSTGVWCYCRMTSPAPASSTQRWVAAYYYARGATKCAEGCASQCADKVRLDSTVRAALFSTYAM
ncbi:MAG: hypothetical protein MJ170_03725 [Alphaproteobacteria bacterium]|nr:hypothetical protein [Alphaproteobacteria bacterium]